MPVTTVEQEYARLRGYLNPYIKGPKVDAVLTALASASSSYLVNSISAVNNQMYIATASGQYLDSLLAQFGITRPANVGLSDDVFSTIGLQVKNRKQVRDLINNILDSMFGDEYVKAFSRSNAIEPYNLANGDTLLINFDGSFTATIPFETGQFQNIATATAQEVADVITESLSSQGLRGSAIANNSGNGNFVEIVSDTIGPASSVTIMGGSAQNELLFDAPVNAGGNMSTQWTISVQSGGTLKFTWSGGAAPQLGKLTVGDYVNIFGGGFASSANEGSFTITDFQGGPINTAFFQVYNPLGTSGIVTQGLDDAILFYNPVRHVLASQSTYAVVYQTASQVLQIFLPASTQVIRRSRIGSAHLHDTTDPISLLPNQPGPYVYDLSQPFVVGSVNTTLTQTINAASSKDIQVVDSSQFPNSQGYFVIGYGTEEQEGPIPYLATPTTNSILISPFYTIQNVHASGSTVTFVPSRSTVSIAPDGSDYPFYITDTVSGRLYAESLINSVVATGITVVFTVLFPGDKGLGKWGTQYSEISEIWGP